MTSRSSLGSRGSSWTRRCARRARASSASSSSTTSRAISRSSGSVSASRSRRAACELRADGAQVPVVVDDGRELGLLAPERRGCARGRTRPPGRDHSASISVEAALELVETLLEAHDRRSPRLHRPQAARRRPSRLASRPARSRPGSARARGPGCPRAPSRRWPRAPRCIDAMATSIIESSGCLVVIDWSQMPGRNSQRTSAVARGGGRPSGGSRRRPPR